VSYKSTGLVFAEKPSIGIEPTRLYDRSRHGNHGTYTDITDVQLPSGLWVRSFNGSTSKIVIPIHYSQNIIKEDFTLKIWAWLDTTGTHRVFFGGSTLDAPHLFSRNNENILLAKPSTANAPAANTNMVTESWQFIACAFDSHSATNNCQYVRNGEDDGLVTFDQDFDVYLNGIGVGNNATDYWWDGMLGLPEIVLRKLSVGELKKIFEAERSWFGV